MKEHVFRRNWQGYIGAFAIIIVVLGVETYRALSNLPTIYVLSTFLVVLMVLAILGSVFIYKQEKLGLIDGESIKLNSLNGLDIVLGIGSLDSVIVSGKNIVFSLKLGSEIKVRKSHFRKNDIEIMVEWFERNGDMGCISQ